MSFAILRNDPAPLNGEMLRRAFRGLPGLAPSDAETVCNENGGLLCRGLSLAQASGLQAKLKAEGVEVFAVDESQLPALPPSKFVRKVEINPEAFLIEDVVRGMRPVAWDQIRLLAAGSVQLTKVSRKLVESDEPRTEHIHISHGIAVPIEVYDGTSGYVSKETVDWFLRAEILLADGATRYSIEAERFNFIPLGEGVTRDLAGNFCLLIRGLAAHAKQARLNHGAAAIVADPCEFAYYPRKGAFYDEITWMLWKDQQGAV